MTYVWTARCCEPRCVWCEDAETYFEATQLARGHYKETQHCQGIAYNRRVVIKTKDCSVIAPHNTETCGASGASRTRKA